MPIFFCYSHQDKDFVDKLVQQLILRCASAWANQWQLNVGDSLVGHIQDAIQKASAVVAVLSRASVSSSWVQRELQSIIYREIVGEPALVIDVANADRVAC